MIPAERMVHDTRRQMRRQSREAALSRLTPYSMAGGPRRRAPPEPEAGMLRDLLGGGAPPLSSSFDGVLRLSAEVEAMQERPRRAPPTIHPGCCHCAWRAPNGAAVMPGPAFSASPTSLFPPLFSRRMFDAHSHVFGTSALDFLVTLMGAASTGTLERIGWLADDLAAAGVSRMVISGFYDGTALGTGVRGDWILGGDGRDPAEVDYSVMLAARMHPDYFVPLTNGFSLYDGDPVAALRARLDAWAGWKGIGEIIVHGHDTDHYDKTEEIKGILRVAVEYGLPVQVHWDIGAVTAGSAEDNFAQLEDVLDAVPDAEVILAHCGLGPWRDGVTPMMEFEAWQGRVVGSSGVSGLLERPNVYFDLAGMQVGDGVDAVRQLLDARGEATPPGAFLLRRMATHAERFLLGIDAETRSFTEIPPTGPGDRHYFGVEQYVESVSYYLDFLRYGLDEGLLDMRDVRKVRHTNAASLFDV